MRRAERDAIREEEEKAKLCAEMPLRELEALIQSGRSGRWGKCECCFLCIGHFGCLLDHPPPDWCYGARHHYLWRTRARAQRALGNDIQTEDES